MKGVEEQHTQALRQFKAEVFATLAHPTRIQIVECLMEGEISVRGIVERLEAEPSNVSQHLALLRSKGLVQTRKQGNQVFYRLKDPMLADILGSMRSYFIAHLEESLSMLRGLRNE